MGQLKRGGWGDREGGGGRESVWKKLSMWGGKMHSGSWCVLSRGVAECGGGQKPTGIWGEFGEFCGFDGVMQEINRNRGGICGECV
ncbi:hypothetical protein LBMAG46_23080 [Planctomycetia bacterium]|nr:hypothetical protein LBMAG46_23080 [Planctomycetia bacterium]